MNTATFDNKPMFYESTVNLQYADSAKACSTFDPFPFDSVKDYKPVNRTEELLKLEPNARKENINHFYKESCQATTDILDRVYGHGLKELYSTVILKGLFPNLTGFKEEDVKASVSSHLDYSNKRIWSCFCIRPSASFNSSCLVINTSVLTNSINSSLSIICLDPIILVFKN